MRRPARTTLIPARGKRPVLVERTPLQGFIARSVIAERQAEAVSALVATKPEEPAPTAPLADDVARLVRGKNRFPEILYGDASL